MQRTLGVIAGLTLAAAAAAPAAAQSVADTRAVRFGVQGGLSLPMGDDSDVLEMGFTVGGLVDYMPATLPIGVRFNLDYTRWGAKDVDESASVISGTAAAMFTAASARTCSAASACTAATAAPTRARARPTSASTSAAA